MPLVDSRLGTCTRSARAASPIAAAILRAWALLSLLSAGCRTAEEREAAAFRPPDRALSPDGAARGLEEAEALYRAPRTPERVERSLAAALDAVAPANGGLALIAAARASAWLAQSHPSASRRRVHTLRGTAIAREAVRRLPGEAGSHYYLAVNLGCLSDLERTASHLEEMAREAQAAIELNERFERAGPHRFLGNLHLRTQGRLLVGFGDLDVALKHLRRAAELFPADPENRLDLGEALIADEDYDGARRELAEALRLPSAPELGEEGAAVRRRAEELQRGIAEKK